MTDDVGKLSLKFFDPATRFIFSSSSGLRDYVCTRHLAMIVLLLYIGFFSAKLRTDFLVTLPLQSIHGEAGVP